MINSDDITLKNFEDEDISDVIVKLEKSFAIQFGKNAFSNIKTFGDICDVFLAHVNYEHVDGCTKQQAFYKIRKAMGDTQLIAGNQVKPDSNLADLFPRQNRIQKIKEFQQVLGINVDLLTYPGWLGLTFISGILLSFIAFFFDWKIGFAGVGFFVAALKMESKLGKELNVQTVAALTEKLATEHYIAVRRKRGTVNRNEILNTIQEAFSTDMGIDKEHLTREAKLGWA